MVLFLPKHHLCIRDQLRFQLYEVLLNQPRCKCFLPPLNFKLWSLPLTILTLTLYRHFALIVIYVVTLMQRTSFVELFPTYRTKLMGSTEFACTSYPPPHMQFPLLLSSCWRFPCCCLDTTLSQESLLLVWFSRWIFADTTRTVLYRIASLA